MIKSRSRLRGIPLLFVLFVFFVCSAVPVRPQRLGIEVAPSQPRALQEFEVSYTADGEIASIEMPRWGALTLVKELGRSRGTQTTIRNGVTTSSETYAYRYLVRAPAGGEMAVPGTTAVIGGKSYRCEATTVTVLPALPDEEPLCRIVYDSVVSRRMGGHILRLTCDRKPDSKEPVLLVDGTPVRPMMSGYSNENGREEYVYRYRVAVDGPGTYSCAPQLSFGGRPFAMEPYVISVESASVSFGRRWL